MIKIMMLQLLQLKYGIRFDSFFSIFADQFEGYDPQVIIY